MNHDDDGITQDSILADEQLSGCLGTMIILYMHPALNFC